MCHFFPTSSVLYFVAEVRKLTACNMGPLYSKTVIDRLAIGRRDVTSGTAEMGPAFWRRIQFHIHLSNETTCPPKPTTILLTIWPNMCSKMMSALCTQFS